MSALAMQRDALMPRAPGGMRRGLLLAIVAHVLLVAALSFSVNWHTQVPDAAEAELWAAVPQAAAPRAAEPPPRPEPPTPPPPRAERAPPPPPAEPPAAKDVADAQIALERAKQAEQRREEEAQRKKEAARVKAEAREEERKLARAQAETDRAKAKEDAARKSKDAARQIEAQAERLEAQREANLKRIIGQAGGSAAGNATGAAAVNAAPSADYIGRIKGRIRPNVSFPNTLPGNPAVEIEVRVAADGRILSTRVLKASGAPEWDDAVLRAIDKTEVLPRDENGRVPPAFVLVYRPRD